MIRAVSRAQADPSQTDPLPYQALRAANAELVRLYWDIGEAIHRKQESLGWGRSVVETLARDLQAEFPGRNGFSARNLWNMRDLYLAYRDKPRLQPLVAGISWAKNLVILGRCYEKYLSNQTSFDQTLSPALRAQAVLGVKDHYTFDFLNLAEAHSAAEG